MRHAPAKRKESIRELKQAKSSMKMPLYFNRIEYGLPALFRARPARLHQRDHRLVIRHQNLAFLHGERGSGGCRFKRNFYCFHVSPTE